jgi:hypothetical protein
MKKMILMTVVTLCIAGLLSGCVSTTGIEGVTKTGSKYHLGKEDDSYMVFMDDKQYDDIRNYSKVSDSTVADYRRVLYAQLNAAAKETKKMGFDYFVMTNSNINNLSGFPINNANELVRYITLNTRKKSFATNGVAKKNGLITIGTMQLKFKPVPASMLENGLVSVWSVEDVLRDTE